MDNDLQQLVTALDAVPQASATTLVVCHGIIDWARGCPLTEG